MNLSKKLLLALAGTGMMAPMAASAQELASLNGAAAINDYMQQQDVDRFRAWESKNQVTSVTQFSDVQPTDWAYQALSNLVEKYGCVAGYPNGTYRGGQAMTRYEAAALLNACLDRVTEVTDELQRLMEEFKAELATLRGRVDGLEKKVGKLESQQFSTTTKLKGQASFIIGGLPNNNALSGGAKRDKTTFNYDYRLTFETSYTGKDLLLGRLRSGNFGNSPFGSSSNIFNLDTATNTGGTSSTSNVALDRLYYTFPVGKEVKLTAGALMRNTELLSFRPSVYNSGLLDFFGLGGTTGTYNKATGAGFGFQWKQKVKKGNPYATFDASYIAAKDFDNSTVGAFDEEKSGISVLTQLGFRGMNWGTAVAYRYGGGLSQVGRDGNISSTLGTLTSTQSSNSVSIGAFWQPMDAKWMPSISAGYGFSDVDGGTTADYDVQSWMVGFQWNDVFQKGNSAGFAVGQAPFASNQTETSSKESFLWEFFYKFQATDKISITPGIFYSTGYQAAGGDSTWGGVIQTTFKF